VIPWFRFSLLINIFGEKPIYFRFVALSGGFSQIFSPSAAKPIAGIKP
jgi:hypothetical protein